MTQNCQTSTEQKKTASSETLRNWNAKETNKENKIAF